MIITKFKFKSTVKQIFSQRILSAAKQSNYFYKMSYANFFADAFVDRCSEQRKNKEWINDKLNHSKTNFILFHIDKPFVTIDDSKKEFNLCKLNYSQIEFLLNKNDEQRENCITIFLGLEYKRLIDENNNSENLDENKNNLKNLRSPYLSPDLYDRSDYKPWFAIDTSNYDKDPQNIEKLFKNGVFLQGNFIRMLSMQHKEEASLIAQVSH